MKKSIIVLMTLLFILTTGSVYANSKIGIVDMQKALDECESGKDAIERMKKEYQALQKDIDEKSNVLKKMQEELNTQSAILTEEAKQAKIEDYQKRLKDLQRLIKDSNDELKKKEQAYVNRIGNELKEVVGKLGKELNYNLILEKRESAILFNSGNIDITSIVIERYNKEWRAKK